MKLCGYKKLINIHKITIGHLGLLLKVNIGEVPLSVVTDEAGLTLILV